MKSLIECADAETARSLRNACEELDRVFPRVVPRTPQLCVNCSEAEGKDFDALVARFRKRRLEMPIEALERASLGHGSPFVHRSRARFSYFIPALLCRWISDSNIHWLDELQRIAEEARSIDIDSPSERWSGAEICALSAFFRLSLSVAVHCEPGAGPDPLAITELGLALDISPKVLIDVWTGSKTGLSHLISWKRAHFRAPRFRTAFKKVFATPMLCDHIEQEFWKCADPALQREISELEEHLRSLILETHALHKRFIL